MPRTKRNGSLGELLAAGPRAVSKAAVLRQDFQGSCRSRGRRRLQSRRGAPQSPARSADAPGARASLSASADLG